MASTKVGSLTLELLDKMSGPAKKAGQALGELDKMANALGAHSAKNAASLNALGAALKGAEANAKGLTAAIGKGENWGSGFQKQLTNLRLSTGELDEMRKSWRALQAEMKGKGVRGNVLADQWKVGALASVQAVRAAQIEMAARETRTAKQQAADQKRLDADVAKEKARLAKDQAREAATAAKNAARADADALAATARAARQEAQRTATEARTLATAARRAERDAERDSRRFGRGAGAIAGAMGRNALYAAGGVGTTYMAARGIRAGANAGGVALREDARDYLAGLTPAQTAQLSGMALEQSGRYKSMTSSSLHALYRESATTSIGVEGTAQIAPDLAKAMTVIQSLKGKDTAVSQLSGFLRGLDTLGKNVDPATIRSLLDGMTRAAGVQGMEYKPSDMWTFAKYAKSAGGGLDNNFINRYLPQLMGDMSASRIGTALATYSSSVIGGSGSGPNRKRFNAQTALGIRQKDGKLSAANIALASSPEKYAEEVLLPALRDKRGVKFDGSEESNRAISAIMNEIYPQMVADMYTKLLQQRKQYQIGAGKMDLAPGLAGADKLETIDPFVALSGVSSQMLNAAAEISAPIITTIMPALSGLAGGLNTLAASIKSNPEVAKLTGGIGAAAAGGGILAGIIGGGSAFAGGAGAFGTAVAGIFSGIGGAIVTAIPATMIAAATNSVIRNPDQYKALTENPMLGAMSPDAALAAAIMNPGAPGPGFSMPSMTMPNLPSLGDPSGADLGARIMEQTQGVGEPAGAKVGEGIASGLASAASSVAAQASSIFEGIKSLFSSGVNVPVRLQSSTGSPGSETAPGRASGGHLSAGSMYEVGEYRKELFVPDTAGTLYPGRSGPKGGGGGGSVGVNSPISISITGSSNAEETANTVMARLESSFKDIVQGALSDYGLETV